MKKDRVILGAFLLANTPEIITQEEFNEVKQAISNLIKDSENQEKENTDLKELYIRIAKHFEKEGHIELSKHMLAQIEATPYFTTWEEYTTWVSKDKIREKLQIIKSTYSQINGDYFNMNNAIQALEELLEEE